MADAGDVGGDDADDEVAAVVLASVVVGYSGGQYCEVLVANDRWNWK